MAKAIIDGGYDDNLTPAEIAKQVAALQQAAATPVAPVTPVTTAAQFRAAEQATLAQMQGKQPTQAEKQIIATIPTGETAIAPKAATPAPAKSNLPAGFIGGSLPDALKKFFGDDPNVIGYKITTNPDGTMSVSVAKSDGQVIGFGARIKQNPDGTYATAANTASSAQAGSTTNAAISAATSAQENAIELLKRTFANYGLESLAETITDLVRKGYGGDTVSLMLQDTQAYKDRFAANEARKKAGLPVLSPAEYLATESAYRNVMQAAGLPKGFYDSSDDFKKFLENDMSPSELKQRVQTAADAIENADPLYAQQLQKLYGLSKGDMIAHTLDPERALPLLQRRANAVNYATAAAQQGIDVSAPSAEYYAGDLGITAGQARQGFSQIAQTMPTYEKLQQIYGGTPSTSLQDLQAATFGGLGETAAQQRIRKFGKQEQATFGGSSGVSQASLGGQVQAGQL